MNTVNTYFHINQGHQITDEEIYHSMGDIPVLTGNNEIKGFWNKEIINKKDLPCLTYPSKANSGVCFIQQKVFDANNTAILIPREEWRDKIILNWVAFKLSKIFPKIATSKGGVNYLNKEIVEDLEFNLIDKDLQKKEYEKISELTTFQKELEKMKQEIEKIKDSNLFIEYKKYQGKQIPATKIFDCMRGNSGMTEEFLYSLMLHKGDRKFKVLTGSINIKNAQKTYDCYKPKKEVEKINKLVGEGIHVVRKGKAGTINYLSKGNYTLNDDAYILVLKKDIEYDILLKWFACEYSHVFKEYASSSDNGTWNKSGFFEHATFNIPSIEEQEITLQKFEELEKHQTKINGLIDEIKNILDREVL